MVVLNQEQIRFIDDYLQGSKVRYVDVRSELMDHIATAVEHKMQDEALDFYEAFKAFMAVNKSQLLQRNNATFAYLKEGIVSFCHTLWHPINLIFGGMLLFLMGYFDSILSLQGIHYACYFLILCLGLTQRMYFSLVMKRHYLRLEYLNYALMTIYFFSAMLNGWFDDFKGNAITLSISITLFFAYSRYSFATIQKFKTNRI
ncbi:MAG: hypothetical protein EAZ58_09435 [Flavobacterium sp.]|nr:MAG: hypothetical protein EAZ58_09435 [Flavobacterium sp.]